MHPPMGESGPRLHIEGDPLRAGTSIFISGMNRVAWVVEINDDRIVLESTFGVHEVDMEQFQDYLAAEKIHVESQPPLP